MVLKMSKKKRMLNDAIKEVSKIIFYVEYESCNTLRTIQVIANNAAEARKKADRTLSEFCMEHEIKNISAV